jgi:TFIIF-interacting CTD phosphatase-like protein
MTNSATAEPNERMFLEDQKLNIWYYERDGVKEFLEYVSDEFEPILFSNGTKEYVDFVVKQIDPDDKYFRHRLYQNSCYKLEKSNEDLEEFVKDIS